jgi:hypothetical protein
MYHTPAEDPGTTVRPKYQLVVLLGVAALLLHDAMQDFVDAVAEVDAGYITDDMVSTCVCRQRYCMRTHACSVAIVLQE